MEINNKPLRSILIKQPWLEVQPGFGRSERTILRTGARQISEPEDPLRVKVKTQSDFLREFHPSAHKINDKMLYPDIYKQDPETKKWYVQPITRRAYSFQPYIRDKQTEYLTGNDIQMELTSENPDENDVSRLASFRKGWLERDMEVLMHEAVEAEKTVGDVAALIYRDDSGKTRYKVYSYADDARYKLYPHFDGNGELELMAIRYYDLDEQGGYMTEWVEVWDKKKHYVCKREVQNKTIKEKVAAVFRGIFSLDGYIVVKEEEHGASFVPIAYKRNPEGPAWSRSQQTIEDFEEDMSYFGEGNKAFAFPIFYVKGEGVNVVGDMNGSVKSIDLPVDGEAGYIQRQEASDSFHKQLEWEYRLIHEQSFVTKPIDVRSGDLPGVAIKLLYTLTLEKAMHDAAKWKPFLNTVARLFGLYYGLETNQLTDMTTIPMNVWIEPYVHENDSELFQNMNFGVSQKFLSRQTASERISKYSKNGEINRIKAEMEYDAELETEKANAQMEFKEEMAEKQTEASIRAQAKYSSGGNGGGQIEEKEEPKDKQRKSGSKFGGRNRFRTTDQYGNHPFENNWRK